MDDTGPIITGGNDTPLTKEQIEGHVSALRSLVATYNRGRNVSPIRLNFEEREPNRRRNEIATGERVSDEDLGKPFKELSHSPLTRRLLEFSAPEHKMPSHIKLYDGSTDPEDHLSRFSGAAMQGSWPMPVWCRMFQQTLDGSARGWYDKLPPGSIDEWASLRHQFVTRFSSRKKCFRDPTEITRIIRNANESLPEFKERWTTETRFIQGVPEIMRISSFMDACKTPELAKRFADKVPKTVEEMMTRVDDFVRAEKAFLNTELPRGERSEVVRKFPDNNARRMERPFRGPYRGDRRNHENRASHHGRDGYSPYRSKDKAPLLPPGMTTLRTRIIPSQNLP